MTKNPEQLSMDMICPNSQTNTKKWINESPKTEKESEKINKFCVIIPDRGDRKDFTKHCLYQMSVQTVKPDKIYHIKYEPTSPVPDLIIRIRCGINHAERDGYDLCYIIENDDFYPINYFQKMQFEDYDFIGIGRTIYYSLLQKKYRFLNHKEVERLNYDRSSLFCTGFRISALKDFEFPDSTYKYLDLDLWRYARIKGNYHLYNPVIMPIGMKHGIGLCGGGGHKISFHYDNNDSDLEWLKNNVTQKSYEFYLKVIRMINN
jgi:hypothetical protein